MSVFAYIAKTREGTRIEGTLEASDQRAAVAQLERQGSIPISVEESTGRADKAAAGAGRKLRLTLRRGGTPRMGTREVLIFTTELSDLLASGMTLGNALNTLARRRTDNAGDAIVAGLRDEIIRGASLSKALEQYPATFPRLYVSMIEAGEASGALHEVLQRLVTHYERIQEVKEKVGMALVYPAIVMVLGFATIIFSMVYVVPKFTVIFAELGETLPLPTRILINTSAWLARYGWAALIIGAFGVVMASRAVKTPRGRLWWHNVLLNVPLLRGIVASSVYANLARTLGTLLANGVPVLQALGILENTVGNAVIAREIHNARNRVTDGTTISGPLAQSKVFPLIMTDMLSIGEQTGDMAGALAHISRRYENELDRNVKIFTTALEPILIVFVAVGVGFVAISILMAVFNLTNGLDV